MFYNNMTCLNSSNMSGCWCCTISYNMALFFLFQFILTEDISVFHPNDPHIFIYFKKIIKHY